MSVDQMRLAVTEAYPGWKWACKVAKMPNNQVIAIYRNLQRTGQFNKKKTKPKGPQYTQLHLSDFGLEM